MSNQATVPASTGIGAPSNGASPASLERSPGAAAPGQQAQRIPFTRASSVAAMQDATLSALAPGVATQVNLLTNAFLAYIILNVQVVTSANAATVKWNADGPYNILGAAGVQLTDPSNQAIVTAISGFKLAQLNKFLADTGCNFDPSRDPNFAMLPSAANNGAGSSAATAGSASFRLVIPVENRRRDALGALTNSAANEQMHLIITPAASFGAGTDTENNVYSTAPTTLPTLNIQVWQMYWTSPPAVIVSGGSSVPTARTPSGLGTVGYVRAERHAEIAGGGSAPFQLSSVGDVITNINWTLRTSTTLNTRATYAAAQTFNAGYAGSWPSTFNLAINDFTVLALGQDMWLRELARFFDCWSGVSAQAGSPGALDAGVFSLAPFWRGLFDGNYNFDPAGQYLATEAGTKIQVRDTVWGASAAYLEVDVRILSPESGASLYA